MFLPLWFILFIFCLVRNESLSLEWLNEIPAIAGVTMVCYFEPAYWQTGLNYKVIFRYKFERLLHFSLFWVPVERFAMTMLRYLESAYRKTGRTKRNWGISKFRAYVNEIPAEVYLERSRKAGMTTVCQFELVFRQTGEAKWNRELFFWTSKNKDLSTLVEATELRDSSAKVGMTKNTISLLDFNRILSIQFVTCNFFLVLKNRFIFVQV